MNRKGIMRGRRISSAIWIASAVLMSCQEENNIFDEVGLTTGGQVAEVRLSQGANAAEAGTTVTREVRFWSVDDTFDYLGLWEQVSLNTRYEVKIEESTFSERTAEITIDWREVREENFSFADWEPKEKIYLREISYDVDMAYDEVLEDAEMLSFDDFSKRIPENFESLFYDFCIEKLSENQLKNVVLTKGTLSDEQFNELYGEDGLLTTAGEEQLRNELKSIGLEKLAADTYEIAQEYTITLAYRVTNGSGTPNESRIFFTVF